MYRRFLFILLLLPCTVWGQTDTLYINGKKLPARVYEVMPDMVRYTLEGDEHFTDTYRNQIQKIVFRTGKAEQFFPEIKPRAMLSVADFDSVQFSEIPGQVGALFKLGAMYASSATGLNDVQLQEFAARRKLKILAAMMGYPVLYITDVARRDAYYEWQGARNVAVNAKATVNVNAYRFDTLSLHAFKQILAGRTRFKTAYEYILWPGELNYYGNTNRRKLDITGFQVQDGNVYFTGNLRGNGKNKRYQLAELSPKRFSFYYMRGSRHVNMVVNL